MGSLFQLSLQSIVVSLSTLNSILDSLIKLIDVAIVKFLQILDVLGQSSLGSSAVRLALFLLSGQVVNSLVQIGLKTIHLSLQVLDVFIVVLT